MTPEQQNVLDAAKAWYENVASGLMYESMDVSDRLLSDAVRALVASEPHEAGCNCWNCWLTAINVDTEIRASIALDKGEDRTRNVDDDASGEEG